MRRVDDILADDAGDFAHLTELGAVIAADENVFLRNCHGTCFCKVISMRDASYRILAPDAAPYLTVVPLLSGRIFRGQFPNMTCDLLVFPGDHNAHHAARGG